MLILRHSYGPFLRHGVLVVFLLSLIPYLRGQPVNPDIRMNNQTGANPPAASGAPGNLAAVSNANCCHTNGASTNTITCLGHGFGAFPVDGSSALWIGTGSGRRWTKVTGFPTGDTITVTDNFNIAAGAPLDCAIGGKIAGPLSSTQVPRVCDDLQQGWTLTVENTGVDYVGSGSCPVSIATGSIQTEGRSLIRGDDPANPTRLVWQTNGNYIDEVSGASSVALENLHFVKDAVGTTGIPYELSGRGGYGRNLRVSNQTGQWSTGFGAATIPTLVLESLFTGPFRDGCVDTAADQHSFIGNTFLGCSGSREAIVTFSGGVAPFLFNILDQEGVDEKSFGGGTFDGFTGWLLFSTLLNSGGSGIQVGFAESTVISGFLVEEASTLSGSCFDAGTVGAPSFGGAGEAHALWRGNAANLCPTARYTNGLESSPEGSATDIDSGAQFDPLFQDEPNLDFFPLNTFAKTDLAIPGATFPYLTPAEPVSAWTVGAAQREGGAGGPSNYAY